MTQFDNSFTSSDVPSIIFKKFIEDLKSNGMTDDLLIPLRNALLVEKSFTEKSFRYAIFGEDVSE